MNLIILNRLKKGRENAVKKDELMAITNLKERAVINEIAYLRAVGVPILSNTQEGGYYLPGTKEEAEDYIRSMDSRAKKIFTSSKATKQWLKDNGYYEQQELF
ncbi:MAG TPA: hypothetical protein DHS57_07790 [Erysipelotrichaceae bacterium]|nr:hypothetical protein [Erysipelotrichaceae bacterium]